MARKEEADGIAELRALQDECRLIPFIGAGFSKPLSLPLWDELVAMMASDDHFEPEIFELHGTPLQLAEYHRLTVPEKYEQLIHWMCERFNSEDAQNRRRRSMTHKALTAIDWHSIYTTNFDAHIEGALRDAGREVRVLASLHDFQRKNSRGAIDVVKFHGTLEEPKTIVLTEHQYFARMSFEQPVDQRLRADVLSHGFMFLGYSFSDPNIRYIWHRVRQLREGFGSEALRIRSFYVGFGVGPIQERLLDALGIDVIELDPTDKSASLARLLSQLGE